MKTFSLFGSLVAAASTVLAQAPLVSNVVNAASGIVAGLPNSGIAQGAIFIITGSNLGPANISIAPTPFQSTNLSGTSVAFTAGGQTANALMYYTSASQVAGLLPSTMPVGNAFVRVTYNGQNSAPVPISVVSNSLGIFTVTQNGSGVGVVTYADYSYVSASKAANPGDTLIIWATGLGPVSGNDASGTGLGVNMPSIPLTVWLGGVSAPVVYQGRSGCCIGEDQIVFTVPGNIPTGCSVPLVVQIGNQISNNTLMPVAKGSRICTPTNPALLPAAVQQLINGQPFSYGSIELRRHPSNTGSGSVDEVEAIFARVTVGEAMRPFMISLLDLEAVGTCLVYNSLNGQIDPPFASIVETDPGSSITVSGPNGTRTLTQSNLILSATGNYLSPGAYTISMPGGQDVGSFTTTLTIPAPAVLTAPASSTAVKRANGMTINWTGGAPNSYVQIDGASATDNSFTNGASFSCLAPTSAGSFTVPPSVLLALPAGPNAAVDFKPLVTPQTFTAAGLNLGVIQAIYDTQVFVVFQ